MRRFEFEWDDGNEGHIARHNVSSEEVEEVFRSRFHLLHARLARYAALGQTEAGRYLFCVFERKGPGLIRVVTARDMEDWERKLYKRKR
jgi:uncharacterized DUF497 family protein